MKKKSFNITTMPHLLWILCGLFCWVTYLSECSLSWRIIKRDHTNSITLSTNSFLVTFRYHIAKAFFVDNLNLDKDLIIRFNSKLVMILFLCRITGVKFTSRYSEVYLNNRIRNFRLDIAVFYLFKYIGHALKTRIKLWHYLRLYLVYY